MAEHDWKLRLIPEAEYSKGLPPDNVAWPHGSLVIGAFNTEGKLIGRIGMVEIAHIEGTWVAEEQRGSNLVHELVKGLLTVLELIGRDKVMSFIPDEQPELGPLAERHGFHKLPLTVWVKEK